MLKKILLPLYIALAFKAGVTTMKDFKELLNLLEDAEAILAQVDSDNHDAEDIVDAWGFVDKATQLEIFNFIRASLSMNEITDKELVAGIDIELGKVVLALPDYQRIVYHEAIRKKIGLPLKFHQSLEQHHSSQHTPDKHKEG